MCRQYQYSFGKVLSRVLPDWRERFNAVRDPRSRQDYEPCELLMASVFMHQLRMGSRHSFNQLGKQEKFLKNYQRIFGLRLPHLDTVGNFLEELPAECLEELKAGLVGVLIEKRILHRFKQFGKFVVAIDGTGTHSYQQDYCGQCLKRTSKHGKDYFFHYLLEAKLVSSGGLCISLASEWVENPPQGYDKQDCELKAFKRLAVKLKKYYPRLPMVILGDGLYANAPVMNICRDNGWDFIFTLKEESLKNTQEIIQDIHLLEKQRISQLSKADITPHSKTQHEYICIQGLEYEGHGLTWVCCQQSITHLNKGTSESTRFVHISSLETTQANFHNLSLLGRMRWKIENEGFNDQKNHGYNLQHKFSRTSFTALKNYYQTLQIACIFHQLTSMEHQFGEVMKKSGYSLKFLMESLRGLLQFVDTEPIKPENYANSQFRLAG